MKKTVVINFFKHRPAHTQVFVHWGPQIPRHKTRLMGLYHEELLNAGFRNNAKHLWESLLQRILGAQNQLAVSVPP